MENSLISIIVPIYNVEKYLLKCINSIINQTYKNLEIILIDDGSTDKSSKICDEFAKKDKRIKVIHKKNAGVSVARNLGIDEAKGDYIQFIDSDDYIDLDMIELLYKNLKKFNADISMCSFSFVSERGITSNGNGELFVYTREEVLKEILLDARITSYIWNKLFSKRLFDGIRFPDGKIFEDAETVPKIFEKAQKVVLEEKPKYYYVQRSGSILHTQNKDTRMSYIKAALRIVDFMKEKVTDIEAYCAYFIAHVTMNTYNEASYFELKDVLQDELVQELYNKLCEIFKNREYEALIVENSSNVKKLHYYYLITDREEYIKNNKQLPMIYPNIW